MNRDHTEEQRGKNTKLPTVCKAKAFLQDPNVSACTQEIWENKEEKGKKKEILEEGGQNLHKDSHHLQLSNVPKREECL